MKHIKLFENFEHRETEFSKFRGIDISDVYSFTFIWNTGEYNRFGLSSYKTIKGNYGSVDKIIDIHNTIKSIISNSGVSSSEFKAVLEKNFKVKTEPHAYSVYLEGEDVVTFFEILENINYYL